MVTETRGVRVVGVVPAGQHITAAAVTMQPVSLRRGLLAFRAAGQRGEEQAVALSAAHLPQH